MEKDKPQAPTAAMSFMAAARDYFGQLPGQTTLDFGKEVKALPPEYRAEMTEGLKKLGYNLVN